MTASWDDEKLANLMGKGGKEGLALYGAFWRIAEIVAHEMKGPMPSCEVSYPVWKWCRLLAVRKSHLTSILFRLQKERLLGIEGNLKGDGNVVVKMPNLLKYKDEYAEKSRQARDKLPPEGEGEGEGELKEENTLKAKAKTIAVTSSEVPASASPGVYFLPLPRDQRHEVTEADVATYRDCYPGVDVYAELGKMKGWLLANPQKAKTARGIKAFIANWLGKAQNMQLGGRNGNSHDRIEEITRTGKGALDLLARMDSGPDLGNGSAQTRPNPGRDQQSAADSLVEPNRGRNR